MQLGRQTRTACARELIGVKARDELGIERCLEDAPRLRNREVPTVAEHITKTRAGGVRVVAPVRDLLRVFAETGEAVGGFACAARNVTSMRGRSARSLRRLSIRVSSSSPSRCRR